MTIDFSDLDAQVRQAAFSFLKEQTVIHGDILPRKLLEKGFAFGSERVPLICPQGIHIPRRLSLPLTFCTVSPNMRKPKSKETWLTVGGLTERHEHIRWAKAVRLAVGDGTTVRAIETATTTDPSGRNGLTAGPRRIGRGRRTKEELRYESDEQTLSRQAVHQADADAQANPSITVFSLRLNHARIDE